MKLDEYRSSEELPPTTQEGLSARQQFMTEAYEGRYAGLTAGVEARPAPRREIDATDAPKTPRKKKGGEK